MDASSVWSAHQTRFRTLTDAAGTNSRPDATTTPTKDVSTINVRTLAQMTECENLTPVGLPSPTKRLTLKPQTAPAWSTFSPGSTPSEPNSVNVPGRKSLTNPQSLSFGCNEDKNCIISHQETSQFDQLNSTLLNASNSSSGLGSLSSEASYYANGYFQFTKGNASDSYCSEGSTSWPEVTDRVENVKQSTLSDDSRIGLQSPVFLVDSPTQRLSDNKTLPKRILSTSLCQSSRNNYGDTSTKADKTNYLEDLSVNYHSTENSLCEKELIPRSTVTTPNVIGEQVLDENLESVARYVDELTSGRIERKGVYFQTSAPRLSSTMRDSMIEQSQFILRKQEERRQQEAQRKEQMIQISKLLQASQEIAVGLNNSRTGEKAELVESQIQQMLIRILENQPLDGRFVSNIGNARPTAGEMWGQGDTCVTGNANNMENQVTKSAYLQPTCLPNPANVNSIDQFRRQTDSHGHEFINQLPMDVGADLLNSPHFSTAANTLINLISQLNAHAITPQSLAEATGYGNQGNNTQMSNLLDLATNNTSLYQSEAVEHHRTASASNSVLNRLDSPEGEMSCSDQLMKSITQLDGTQQLSEELRQLSVPYQQILANCESDIERAATVYRNSASAVAQKSEAAYHWSGRLPIRLYHSMTFSRKVFLGGVPWDSTSDDLILSFSRFGNLTVSWPQKDGSLSSQSCRNPSPKGYCYLIFEHESSVADLVAACIRDPVNGGDYYKISSSKYRSKDVQVIPWVITDSQFIKCGQYRPDSKRTVFVGALHGMITAEALVNIMNDLFGNVVFAALDTDKFKYPIGSGRVTFSSHKSYMRAVTANFVDVRTAKFSKTLQIDPYLEDSLCNNCFTSPGIYFCRSFECFRYFCPSCWQLWHNSVETRQTHKPLRRTIRPVQDRMWMMSRL